jgi:hypothetical protein
MPQDEERRANNQENHADKYVEAVERFKARIFVTFGLLIFLIAMMIAVTVEASGAKKIWKVVFSEEPVHADEIGPKKIKCSCSQRED